MTSPLTESLLFAQHLEVIDQVLPLGCGQHHQDAGDPTIPIELLLIVIQLVFEKIRPCCLCHGSAVAPVAADTPALHAQIYHSGLMAQFCRESHFLISPPI